MNHMKKGAKIIWTVAVVIVTVMFVAPLFFGYGF